MSSSWVFPFKYSELLPWDDLCANSASFSCSCVTRPPEPVYSTVNKLCDKPASPRHYSPVECDKSFLLSAPYPHYHLGLLPDSDMTRYCMRFLASPPVACASTRLGGWNSPPFTRFLCSTPSLWRDVRLPWYNGRNWEHGFYYFSFCCAHKALSDMIM